MKLIDLKGKVFGNWIVLYRDLSEQKRTSARWICKCICGTIKSCRSRHLTNEGSKSCGCSLVKDYTGQKFYKWTVVRKIQKKDKKDWIGSKYLCRCDCGNEREMLGGNITNGSSTNCGCWQLKSTEDTALQSLYSSLKNNAKRRNIEFKLEKKICINLFKANCFYCNTEPSQKFNVKNTVLMNCDRIFFYNGIDRIDSLKGYTKENVVTCCKNCNFSKHTMNLEDWKIHLRKLCINLRLF